MLVNESSVSPFRREISYDLLDQDEYFDQLVDRIDQTEAGDRIALLSMGFDPMEPATAKVMNAATRAAVRGVETYAATDAYAFMVDDRRVRPGPLFLHSEMPEQLSPLFQPRLDTLANLGTYALGHYGIINRPGRAFTLPHAGRSHIKGAVVKDWMSFGGANLDHTERLNTMVTVEDSSTADYVYGLYTDIIEAETTSVLGEDDMVYQIDADSELIIDAGVPGQSKILETAIEAIDNADEWIILSSQFLPVGTVADHLLEAILSNKLVYTVYNHPSHMGKLEAMWQRQVQRKARRKLPEAFFNGELSKDLPMNHSKLLATDKETIDGSHNYHPLGVKLGTAEISFHRRDPLFARKAARNLLRMINQDNHPQFAYLTEELEAA